MGGESMSFPETFEEFTNQYKIVDKEQVYTNGSELIPIFRVKQQLEHVEDCNWGEWRFETNEEMPNPMFKLVVCKSCNNTANSAYKFCPNCGRKMKLEEGFGK